MRRFAIVSLVLACVWSPLTGSSEAAENSPAARTGGRVFQRRNPPRFQRESYAEYLVVPRKDGQTQVRQVWNGYVNGFPRPAYLYYGAPHSGDDTGIGAMDRR